MADVAPIAVIPVGALLPPIHVSFYQITSKGHQIVVKSEERRPPTQDRF